jgi:hypothetical protein
MTRVPSTRVGSALAASTRDVGEFAHALSNAASATKTQLPALALLNVTPDNDTGGNLPEFAAQVDRVVRLACSNAPPPRRGSPSGKNQGATRRARKNLSPGRGVESQQTSFVYTP